MFTVPRTKFIILTLVQREKSNFKTTLRIPLRVNY